MAKIININDEEISFADSLPMDYSKLDVVFDCEANGLLDKVTKVWVLVAQDIRTREMYVFTDQFNYGLPCHGSFEDGVRFLVKCRSIIAHNIAGYDWWLLNKFFKKIFNRKTVPWSKTHDTLVQSRSQWYDRPARVGVKGNHGLEYYGNMFGYPKPPIDDWSFWDEDKLKRCIVDVEINRRTLVYLNQEKKERKEMGIDFTKQINITKYAQYRCVQQELNGFKANKELMLQHVDSLDTSLEVLRVKVEPLLPKQVSVHGVKCTWEELRDKWSGFFRQVPSTEYEQAKRNGKIVDVPIKETYFPVLNWLTAEPKRHDKPMKWQKKPKNKKASWTYTSAVCKWFDLDFEDPAAVDYMIEGDFCKVDLETHYQKYKPLVAEWFGISDDPMKDDLIGGPYTRIIIEDAKLSQHAVVKDYLLSLGWVPTEYNKKKDVHGNYIKNPDGSFVNGSPKLTEDSFDSIPEGVGQDIAKYNTLMHRRRTFLNDQDDDRGWLNNIRPDGRVSAGAMCFSTSTGRSSHYNMVNIPSPQAVFGEEMRNVWVASEGCSLISTDQASAQFMILAGLMGDPAFLDAVKNGKEFVEHETEPDKYCEVTGDGKYREYVGTDVHSLNSTYFQLNDMSDIVEARSSQDIDLIHKITKGRKKSKNGAYCLIFGGGNKKFATTVGLSTATEGQLIKDSYFAKLPKLKAVIDRLEAQFDANRVGSGGYIQNSIGYWLWCASKHKVLNYELMSTEAAIQNTAIVWMNEQFEKKGIRCKQVLQIHDEITCECHNDDIELAKEVMNSMYEEASKILGMEEPVTGLAAVGQNYCEVH